jgi:eukaryotic-like serine/threonine-protein kinase
VPATGGTPVAITTLAPKECSHRFPTLLPGGTRFLYAVLPGKDGLFPIYAGSLADQSRTRVASLESAPVYAPPGYLLYTRQGGLVAQPFDAARLKFTGDPVPLEDAPTAILDPNNSFTAERPVSVSSTGAFAYFSAPSFDTTAEWMDAAGRITGTLDVPAGHSETAVISPDGTHAVLDRSVSPSESSLWLVNLVRGGASPLSTGKGRNDSPVWSPDGTRVVFAADRDGPQNFYVKTTGDASPERLLYQSDVLFKQPNVWSPDGPMDRDVAVRPGHGAGCLAAGRLRRRTAHGVRAGPAQEMAVAISPDGRWLAYASNETGRFQLCVQSFPAPGRKQQVSSNGGAWSWWARNGRAVAFVDDKLRTLWRVDVEPGGTLRIGTPHPIAALPPNTINVTAMPDLDRFLVLVPERPAPARPPSS